LRWHVAPHPHRPPRCPLWGSGGQPAVGGLPSAQTQTCGQLSPSPSLPLVYLEARRRSLAWMLARLASNAVAVTRVEGGAEVEHWRVGLALCPRVAMLNHSCRPNAIVVWRGHTATVRLTEAVAAGGEIHISYGPHAGRLGPAARRKALVDQYGFTCRCCACTAAVPRGTRFQCRGCRSQLAQEEQERQEVEDARCRIPARVLCLRVLLESSAYECY
jgi:hypothetical protein